MEHHTLPVISGHLLLSLHLSVTQCPSTDNLTRLIIIVIIYSGHRRRRPWLSVSIKLLKIYVSKIVLKVLFIVEVFEINIVLYCIVLY